MALEPALSRRRQGKSLALRECHREVDHLIESEDASAAHEHWADYMAAIASRFCREGLDTPADMFT
jgi:hypothetical protein